MREQNHLYFIKEPFPSYIRQFEITKNFDDSSKMVEIQLFNFNTCNTILHTKMRNGNQK